MARGVVYCVCVALLAFGIVPPVIAQPADTYDARIKKLEEITGIKVDEGRLEVERNAPKAIRDKLDKARKDLIANASKYPGGKPTFTIGYSPLIKRPLSSLAGTRIPESFDKTFDQDKELSDALIAREAKMLDTLAKQGIAAAPRSTPAAPGAEPVSKRKSLCDVKAKAFDWRELGKVTAVGQQGQCGSCWAFTLAAALESSYLIRNGYPIKVSEQHLLSCSRAGSCSGGWYYDVLRRLASTGAGDGTAYPYKELNTSCDVGKSTPYHWSAWGRVSKSCKTVASYDGACRKANVDEIKEALCRHGPVLTTVVVDDAFQGYRPPLYIPSGEQAQTVEILNSPTPDAPVNHAVLIVGWDDTHNAWLIKNSWGSDYWGYEGFGWVHYDAHKIGTGATWVEARKDVHIPDTCTSFSPKRARVVKKKQGDANYWMIDDDGAFVAAFGEVAEGGEDKNEGDARTALTLMRHYGIDKHCTAARSSDNTPFYFWLAGNVPPTGPFPGEDCVDIEWQRLDVNKVVSDASGDETGQRVAGGANPLVYNWVLSDGHSVLESFPDDFAADGIDNEAEAWKAYAYLKKHRITKLCHMSRRFSEFDVRTSRLRYYRR